jgi:hypothetical protein
MPAAIAWFYRDDFFAAAAMTLVICLQAKITYFRFRK